MTKQLPPRHPSTGRFVTQEHAAKQPKPNKSTSSSKTPPGKQAPSKSEGTRKA